jgi:RNase P subunit RPR2
MACSDARVFLRHASVLPRRMQDVRADDIIMTCKPCGQELQHHATVHLHAADRS